MNKFLHSNQTKKHIIQKVHSFLCNLTYYKSVTKMLQVITNSYKLVTTLFPSVLLENISVIYTGLTGVYTYKEAAK